MEPQKFIKSYKCECFEPHNYCNCPQKIMARDNMIDNVNEVADAIIKVINICGIHLAKTKATTYVIRYYFLHFEEIRHRIDSVPRKRLRKENLIHDLSRKCSMTGMEAQISYSIIKRAFKAFYYGSGEGGVPNYLLSKKLSHTFECLWVHAAQRTAELCAKFGGMFLACQKDLEFKIKLIFKELYDHLKKIPQEDGEQECTCLKCLKRITKESLKTVTVTTHIHDHVDSYEAMYAREQDKNVTLTENEDIQSEHSETNLKLENLDKPLCPCPPLKITENDYAYQAVAESVSTDCCQGAFSCRWIPISKEEFEADDVKLDINLPKEFLRLPSYYLDEECDPECECVCKECTSPLDDILCSELDEESKFEMSKEEIEDTFLSEKETLLNIDTENVFDIIFSNKNAGCRNSFKSNTSCTADLKTGSIERKSSQLISKLSLSKTNE